MRRAAVVAAFVALVAAAGCRKEAPPPPNVVIVTIDTLRADRLGCYGRERAETPAIDRIAREGVLFSRAYSPSPLTLPSHATIFSGLEPTSHGLVDNGQASAGFPVPLLAERFRAAGWETGAFVAAFVLDRIFGLDRGFETYDDGPAGDPDLDEFLPRVAPADERVDRVLAWLRRPRTRPFFLWLHLYDVHEPHVIPAGFEKRFASDPYDGEVAFVDSQLRRLFDALDARPDAPRTLLVVTSDHGESLGEHGEDTHGFFLYDATIRVPLVVRWPGRLPAGRTVDAPAGLVDLAPTLLSLAGLPAEPQHSGVDLFASTPPPDDRLLWAESAYGARHYGWAPLSSIRRGNWKFVSAPRPELLDLATDPGETTNRFEENRREARELASRLDETRRDLERRRVAAPSEPDAESRARLEALGYLASRSRPAPPDGDAVDPKDGIATLGPVEEATRALTAGDFHRAETLYREVVAAHPENLTLQVQLARSLEMGGKPAEALEAYRAAAAGDDPPVVALARCVELAHRFGDRDEELAAATRFATLFPRRASVQRRLAEARAASGDARGAEAAFRAALELEPSSVRTRGSWARFLVGDGRRDEAAAIVVALLRDEVSSPFALGPAALLDEAAGDPAAALRKLDAALAQRPADAELLQDRYRLRRKTGDAAGAEADRRALRELWPAAPALREEGDPAARPRRKG